MSEALIIVLIVCRRAEGERILQRHEMKSTRQEPDRSPYSCCNSVD